MDVTACVSYVSFPQWFIYLQLGVLVLCEYNDDVVGSLNICPQEMIQSFIKMFTLEPTITRKPDFVIVTLGQTTVLGQATCKSRHWHLCPSDPPSGLPYRRRVENGR